MDRTVRPGGPHASCGQYVLHAWFRLFVLSVWACRTEEMTGIYGQIGRMALTNCTGRYRQWNFELRCSVGQD